MKTKDLKKEYIELKCNNKEYTKEDAKYKFFSSLFIEAVNNLKKQKKS